MLPLRHDFLRFGGSWAQRQVFHFTMIQAAVRANKLSVALALVTELKVSSNKISVLWNTSIIIHIRTPLL